MSVVAWDGKKLVADKMLSNTFAHFKTTKIARLNNGDIVGWVGSMEAAMLLVGWLNTPLRSIDNFPEIKSGEIEDSEFSLILVDQKKRLWLYTNGPHPVPIEQRYVAIGSGAEYAMAILSDGGTADKAVKIACKLCPSCGLGQDSLEIVPPPKEKKTNAKPTKRKTKPGNSVGSSKEPTRVRSEEIHEGGQG